MSPMVNISDVARWAVKFLQRHYQIRGSAWRYCEVCGLSTKRGTKMQHEDGCKLARAELIIEMCDKTNSAARKVC